MNKCKKHNWAMFGTILACSICGARKGGLPPIDLTKVGKSTGKGKATGTLTAKK